MASMFGCKWCKGSFPASKVVTVGSASGSIYWVCNPCIKIGSKAAREAAKGDPREKELKELLVEFENAGGRGVELADRIDQLRKELGKN